MRYVFFGTPRFAAIVLERLIDGGVSPSALVCNPDKPVGRKKIITPPPTKEVVLESGIRNQELGIKIFQPVDKNELLAMGDEIFDNCDFGVVAAYAQIIPQEVIDKAKLGIIGVHPSLLPALRGPTPIQTAILEGYNETGVSLFLLDEEIDHGPIIRKQELGIMNQDYEELSTELAELAGNLLVEALPKFMTGKMEAVAQDESEATYTRKFEAEDGFVDALHLKKAQETGAGAESILRKIHAFNPEPGVYTFIDQKRTKLLDAYIKDSKLVLKKIQKEGGVPINF